MTERQPTDDDALANDLIVTSARLVRLVRYRADVDDSTATWRALSILAERGPLRVSDFAAIDRLSQPSATAILRRLREEGAVESVPDPADGRASLISLTALGEARLARLRAAGVAAVTPLLAGLDEADRATLRRASDLLDELTRLPQSHPDTASPEGTRE